MRVPLPELLKRRLRPLPQWCPVGIDQPQDLVEVHLVDGARRQQVNENCVVASLRPLTLALGVSAASEAPQWPGVARLEMLDQATRRIVGALELVRTDDARDFACRVAFYHVASEQQHCLDWPRRSFNRWLQDRAMRAPGRPGNFAMPPEAVQQLMVFYMCPRPVVAVSVQHAEHQNLFPMDLIGPLGDSHFSLALRSTSRSVEAMTASGRIAIADFPAGAVQTAYALGAQHGRALQAWADSPLPMARSRLFGLPVPEAALRVREIEILTSHSIGSHRMFIGRIVSHISGAAGPQLCHVPGIYLRFRELAGCPLLPALPD